MVRLNFSWIYILWWESHKYTSQICPTILNGLQFPWKILNYDFQILSFVGLKFSLKFRCWNGGQTFSLCLNTICFRTGKEFSFVFIYLLFLIEQEVFIHWKTNKRKNGLQWVDNMTRVIFMFLKYLTQNHIKAFILSRIIIVHERVDFHLNWIYFWYNMSACISTISRWFIFRFNMKSLFSHALHDLWCIDKNQIHENPSPYFVFSFMDKD